MTEPGAREREAHLQRAGVATLNKPLSLANPSYPLATIGAQTLGQIPNPQLSPHTVDRYFQLTK